MSYRCNCGEEFPHTFARSEHARECPVMIKARVKPTPDAPKAGGEMSIEEMRVPHGISMKCSACAKGYQHEYRAGPYHWLQCENCWVKRDMPPATKQESAPVNQLKNLLWTDKDARIKELTAQLSKAREALEFYANASNWSSDNPVDMMDDCGDKARETLAQLGEAK